MSVVKAFRKNEFDPTRHVVVVGIEVQHREGSKIRLRILGRVVAEKMLQGGSLRDPQSTTAERDHPSHDLLQTGSWSIIRGQPMSS